MSVIKNVFISREISNAVFKQEMIKRNIDLYTQSLVEISPLEINEVPESDWIFFYSKNGIRHFFNQKIVNASPSLLAKKFAVMGGGSNTLLSQHIKRDADFVASSDIPKSISDFWQKVKKESVLFIKATNSLGTFELTEKDNQSQKLEVYTNFTANIKEIPECGIVALTSPMNAIAYCQTHNIESVQKLIAIGESTKNALLEFASDKEVIIVNEPSEKAILDYIFQIVK